MSNTKWDKNITGGRNECDHLWTMSLSTHLLSHSNGMHVDRVCTICGAKNCGVRITNKGEVKIIDGERWLV